MELGYESEKNMFSTWRAFNIFTRQLDGEQTRENLRKWEHPNSIAQSSSTQVNVVPSHPDVARWRKSISCVYHKAPQFTSTEFLGANCRKIAQTEWMWLCAKAADRRIRKLPKSWARRGKHRKPHFNGSISSITAHLQFGVNFWLSNETDLKGRMWWR